VSGGSQEAQAVPQVQGDPARGGAIYLGQTLRFLKPVYLGDTITATAIVKAVREREKGGYVLTLDTFCENQKGERVLEGEAVVLYEEPTGPGP